ncbi:REP-associated tyrosine transposase [Pseudomonas sp. 5P_3.1_Bac2]|uniref:REP-associated tyrosine transposase n=1 Tax=Pseudomonas sp. 5P_3.1_Bac2 TaxID=2971617 RepID=UPI0021C9F644|nr:transposase [Pseudomonas sp. 5P_3.1_Bac2]MCU1719053.1 transposase [Pseudomonas sp. 5P_3.1_Bac2]
MSTPRYFHSHNLRRGRHSECGRSYLITVAVDHRQPILSNFFVGRLLVAELRLVAELGWVDSLAWVVMPDHWHWLVTLREATLAELMQRVKGRSARSINQALDRAGRLWQAGYHEHALRTEEDMQAVARYLVANPLRAGLVKRVGDYPLWDAVWL